MQCRRVSEVKNEDGTFDRTYCLNKDVILWASDPCAGLCYKCACEQLKAENKELKVENDKLLIWLKYRKK